MRRKRRKTDANDSADLFEAVCSIAAAFDRGSTQTLAEVHDLLGDYFTSVTEPFGRTDNEIEQRLVGTMWAELEEILDHRTNGKD